MKREVKFRAKRLDNNEWVYGGVYWHPDSERECSYIIKLIEDNGVYKITHIPVKHESISQFTGLLDKNGKEVYEGDIIKVHFDGWGGGCEREYIGVVKYINTRFIGVTNSYYMFPLTELKSWNEVIGSIYENPDLLESK